MPYSIIIADCFKNLNSFSPIHNLQNPENLRITFWVLLLRDRHESQINWRLPQTVANICSFKAASFYNTHNLKPVSFRLCVATYFWNKNEKPLWRWLLMRVWHADRLARLVTGTECTWSPGSWRWMWSLGQRFCGAEIRKGRGCIAWGLRWRSPDRSLPENRRTCWPAFRSCSLHLQ